MTLLDNDTIAAPATAAGGALCVVRVSGPRAIDICDTIFRGPRRRKNGISTLRIDRGYDSRGHRRGHSHHIPRTALIYG